MLLAADGGLLENAYDFLAASETALPCLYDESGTWYTSYARETLGISSAPYPLQVVIDRQGVISWIGISPDPAAARAAIRAALDGS